MSPQRLTAAADQRGLPAPPRRAGNVELFVILLIIAAGAWAYSAWSSNRRRQQEREASLASVRAAAAEDVTRLGEDVASLDAATTGRTLHEATLQDYPGSTHAHARA